MFLWFDYVLDFFSAVHKQAGGMRGINEQNLKSRLIEIQHPPKTLDISWMNCCCGALYQSDDSKQDRRVKQQRKQTNRTIFAFAFVTMVKHSCMKCNGLTWPLSFLLFCLTNSTHLLQKEPPFVFSPPLARYCETKVYWVKIGGAGKRSEMARNPLNNLYVLKSTKRKFKCKL